MSSLGDVSEGVVHGAIKGMISAGLRGAVPLVIGLIAVIIPATAWWFPLDEPRQAVATYSVQLVGLLAALLGFVLIATDLRRSAHRSYEDKLRLTLQDELREARTRNEHLAAEMQKLRVDADVYRRTAQALEEFRERERQQRLDDARENFAGVTQLLAKRPPLEVLRELCNAIVRYCQTEETDPNRGAFRDTGYFWVKIYRYDPATENLSVLVSSTGSPCGVHRHRLKLGQGGVGQLVLRAEESLLQNGDGLSARFYNAEDIRHGLNGDQEELVDSIGIQSVLAAPIYARTAKKQGGGQHFPQLGPPNGGRACPVGAVCFCSTLSASETSLQSPRKHANCEHAAELMGFLLWRLLYDDQNAQAPVSVQEMRKARIASQTP